MIRFELYLLANALSSRNLRPIERSGPVVLRFTRIPSNAPTIVLEIDREYRIFLHLLKSDRPAEKENPETKLPSNLFDPVEEPSLPVLREFVDALDPPIDSAVLSFQIPTPDSPALLGSECDSILDDLRSINSEPPEHLSLDGTSVFTEIASLNKVHRLSEGAPYPPPFSGILKLYGSLLAIADREKGVLRPQITAWSHLDPPQLHEVFRNESPALLSFILAYAPSTTLRDYISEFRTDEAQSIFERSSKLDPQTLDHSVFREVERTVAMRLSSTDKGSDFA